MATVLVVEDDGSSRDMLADYLSDHGHAVVTAASGEEAMLVAATHGPDVVLLDLGLPGGIDGWEVARRLRGTATLFATTGRVHGAALNAARENGCAQIFHKPLELAAVLAAVNDVAVNGVRRSAPAAGQDALAERVSLLDRLYVAFNRRDIDVVLEAFHPDVEWPNAWKGGVLHGRAAVRDYWQAQWREIDPQVVPTAYREQGDGRIAVSVHQIVRDRTGAIVFEGAVTHVYEFVAGLVRRMSIPDTH